MGEVATYVQKKSPNLNHLIFQLRQLIEDAYCLSKSWYTDTKDLKKKKLTRHIVFAINFTVYTRRFDM